MQGVCNTAVLQGSNIGTHHFGLNFTSSLGLQPQTDKSNKWTSLGSYTGTDKAARHEGTDPLLLSGIFKTPLSAPFKPANSLISVTSLVNVNQWFFNGNAPSICLQTGNVCTPRPFAMTAGAGDATMQQLIASDIPTTETYEVEQLWESQKQLYETLKEGDAAVYSNDPILSAFVADKEDETIGKLYDVKEQVGNAFTPSATLELQLTQRESDIKLLSTQIAVLDDTYTTGLLTQSDWETQRTTLLGLLDVATTQYKNLTTQYRVMRDNGIDIAKNLNDVIATTAVYETNTKAVNDIYLRTVAKQHTENITMADRAVVNYIAAQCPYTGGTAVYVARALQASIRKDTFYNDTENCFQQGINYRVVKPKKEDKTEVGEINIKIFPNPASSFVTIIANQANQTNNTIQFIDVLGRMVSEQVWALGSNKIIIPTENLVTGVYQCRILDSNNSLISIQKIVIQQP